MNKNDEIFHEIYGCYYDAVSRILNEAVSRRLTEKKLKHIADKYVFTGQKTPSKSSKKSSSGRNNKKDFSPAAAIKKCLTQKKRGSNEINQPLLSADLKTLLQNAPEMPLSLMQKRWLKAVLSDRRIKLFGIEEPEWLRGIEPLFSMEDFVYFDQDLEGDNYSDENYIRNFKTILEALNNGFKLNITYGGKNSNYENANAIPLKLEYSPRNDKFRLFIKNEEDKYFVLNLSKIQEVKLSDQKIEKETAKLPKKEEYIKQLVLILDNSAGKHDFSRAMREFSDLKKETEPLGNQKYKITMEYYKDDEEEIVIRIMAYLPYIEVKKPFEVKKKIQEKLRKQLCFGELK